MQIQENIPLGPKTTMRIGGTARYFAELATKEDVEQAYAFANEKQIPLIVLGSGSNTVFAEGMIDALVVRLKTSTTTLSDDYQLPFGSAQDRPTTNYQLITAEAGKNLAMLINELAAQGLDLSALTGIPGTLGGAIFGNAGQGAKGMWIDSFVKEVTVFVDGEWKTFTKDACKFRYRESLFKDLAQRDLHTTNYKLHTPLIWSAVLEVPHGEPATIKAEVERLLQRRIETQPHVKTAGSCFKSLPDGTPAWQLIEKAGLRGLTVGGIQVSEKHANFLLNIGGGTFENIGEITNRIREAVPQIASIEMRLYGLDGKIITPHAK